MAVAAPPAPVTVLRLPVVDTDWVGALPHVPDGALLTISAPTADLAASLTASAGDLRARGYLFIGHVPVTFGSADPVVDIVVPGRLLEDEPVWWRELSALAVHVLPLLFGPVRRRLAGLVTAHRALRPHRPV